MRLSAVSIALFLVAPVAASAAQPAATAPPAQAVAPGGAAPAATNFTGPDGWSHSPPAGSDPARSVDQWHLAGDVSSLTFIRDTTQSYADALAKIHANIASNNIKTSADRDVTCHGATGHVVEFAYGPDGHRIVTNRVIVPDGSGIDTITYARSSDESFDASVKKAEATFCGGPL